MLGQKSVLHKSDYINVTSTVQRVLTVVWLETHTVPGMVSPAPDTTQLEFSPRGNSSHTNTADEIKYSHHHSKSSCLKDKKL